MYFKTRTQARSFTAKTQRKAPSNKTESGWPVYIVASKKAVK